MSEKLLVVCDLHRHVMVTCSRPCLVLVLIGPVDLSSISLQLRSALDRIEELEATNSQLSKRLEKMKANRNALLGQQ